MYHHRTEHGYLTTRYPVDVSTELNESLHHLIATIVGRQRQRSVSTIVQLIDENAAARLREESHCVIM